ncbi:MAG: alanine racemase, partial [Thermodesulfobacteriota bacterium]
MGAIRHNLGVVRSRAGNCKILAIVKADAYGHGAVPVSRTLLAAGAEALGVAHLEEALELRNAGLSCPLVLLFGLEPSAVAEVVHHNLTPVI